VNFNIIRRKIGKFFPHKFVHLLLSVTDPFLNFILTLLTLLTYVSTIHFILSFSELGLNVLLTSHRFAFCAGFFFFAYKSPIIIIII